MTLMVRPQLVNPDELQIWVGVFGNEAPAAPRFTIEGTDAPLLDASAGWQRIRDGRQGPGGQPLNHQGSFRLASMGRGQSHRIRVRVGAETSDELLVRTLPAAVPPVMGGSFKLLLSSCYSQPNDGGGLLGHVASSLQPDMTVLAGDQVYLDLPVTENLPSKCLVRVAQALGEKYRRNWLSRSLGVPGLHEVLTRAPTVCLPDDHEFWNNYPYPQVQLPDTRSEPERTNWERAARELYQDYQQGGPPAQVPTFWRIDIEPLAMLMLDTRTQRDAQFNRLTDVTAANALTQWRDDLLAARLTDAPRIGVLAAGQALFVAKPGNFDKTWRDAEYANFQQFDDILAVLDSLASAGVPVLFVTGDVHWSRVASATYLPRERRLLWEVISSPSRLISSPGDGTKELANKLGGVFGKPEPWPRHADPAPLPGRFGTGNRFEPQSSFGRRGDRVAMLEFSRVGRGIELWVRYHAIHVDPAIARPELSGPHTLLTF